MTDKTKKKIKKEKGAEIGGEAGFLFMNEKKKKDRPVDVSYFGDKAMSKYNKYKDSKETQLHSDTEKKGFQKAKSRALNEMSQEEGVTPRFNHGGEAVVKGVGIAIKGTGFKGVF